ncbi:hypothetical protein GCM10009616_28830 [Microlunatus lacustris]
MRDDQLLNAAAIAAYQDVTLTELRGLFDHLDFDLMDLLEREARIGDALDGIDSTFEAVRARLTALGISLPDAGPPVDDVPASGEEAQRRSSYEVPLVPAVDDFDTLVNLAESRLKQLGIDSSRDPLLQVLPDSEIARSLRAYNDEHGDISWDETDWAVVLGAGALATLADIVLVRIPQDTFFPREGKDHRGSPITKWLKEKSPDVHQEFLKPLEKSAKVPYDANHTTATGGRVTMGPRNHRLKSLGHDPLTGFFFGVRDLMHGTGTYFDNGKLVQIATDHDPVGLIEALLTQVGHLLSDVATPGGLPAPLFTLLQLGAESPFVHTRAGMEGKATWAQISQYMYLNGYDLRHYFAMGITPAIVSIVIRGYWLLKSYVAGGTKKQRQKEHAKLTSMLLLGHSIATSGNLLKTGLIYGMNPLALNYNQILAMGPVTVAWFKEAVERDDRISQALDREWQVLLVESNREPESAHPRLATP